MAFNRFAAGKKVYGQGSFAPTRGQLNPQGYIQREIKRRNQEAGGVSKVGRDGQSDTRSGLAKNALNRGPLNGGPRQGNVGKRPARQAYAIGERNKPSQSVVGGLPPRAPGAAQAVGNSATAAPVGGPPPVNINSTGQLQLPYNSEFANMALDAQMQFDAENQELTQAEQEQSLAYQQQTRDLDQGYNTQKRGTLNNNAASGTAFSSAYGVGVNEDSRNYNNMKNDMFSENEMFKSGITGRRNAASAKLNSLIQRATQAYADSLAAEAGNLGLDGGGEEAAAAGVAGPAGPPALSATAAAAGANPATALGAGIHATYNPNLSWNDVAPGTTGGGGGGDRGPRPSDNHVWRDGRWIKWSQTTAGKRGEKQPRD